MSDIETLADRLAAVERAVTDGEADLAGLQEGADLGGRLDRIDERLAAVEEHVADLEAATQALRGYVGNVRAVNDGVERRADAALARAEAVERALDDDRIDSFWTDSPPIDPDAGEGWHDEAGPSPFAADGSTNDAHTNDAHDGSESGRSSPDSGENRDLRSVVRGGDLRAVVRRLEEAL